MVRLFTPENIIDHEKLHWRSSPVQESKLSGKLGSLLKSPDDGSKGPGDSVATAYWKYGDSV